MTANPPVNVGETGRTVIRHAAIAPQAWRNGGGITREIAVHPAGAAMDDFTWRVSVADIDLPGAFSTFPGVDRSLTVIDGDTMVLAEMQPAAGRRHILQRWESLLFAGETGIASVLPTGPTRDFNLMWRRGAHTCQVDVLRDATALRITEGSVVCFAAAGSHRLDDTRLDAGDALILRDIAMPIPLAFEPLNDGAVLICARISPPAAPFAAVPHAPVQSDRGVA